VRAALEVIVNQRVATVVVTVVQAATVVKVIVRKIKRHQNNNLFSNKYSLDSQLDT
jgi:hypothetical protein